MIPLVPLVMLAGKLIQSFSKKSNTNPTAHQPVSTGSDFEQRMSSLSSELGWPITKLSPESASFSMRPDYMSTPYQIDIHYDGDVAHVHAISELDFPPGQVPDAVQKLADDMGRLQARGQCVLVRTDRADFFTIACEVPMRELTGALAAKTVGEILPFIKALDSILRKKGYVK